MKLITAENCEIKKLPNEILIKIFSLVKNKFPLLLVNKQFYNILQTINLPWENNGNGINWAIKNGYTDIFIKYIYRADTLWNPLIGDAIKIACENNRVAILMLMLKYKLPNYAFCYETFKKCYFEGMDLHNFQNNICTPLEIAISKNYKEIVELILNYTYPSTNFHILNHPFSGCYNIPIDLISDDHCDILQLFLNDSRFIINDDYNYLSIVCKMGHKNLLKMLLEDGRCDPSIDGSIALYNAAFGNHYGCVMLLLLDNRCNAGTYDNYVIKWASRKNHYDIVEMLLLDPNVDPTDTFNHAYKTALRKNHTDIANLLISDKRVYFLIRGTSHL
jgi:hypothetical protein